MHIPLASGEDNVLYRGGPQLGPAENVKINSRTRDDARFLHVCEQLRNARTHNKCVYLS